MYPGPTLGFIAPYTARCFENSMRFHRRLWDYTPSEKVTVILDDVTDYSNAGVWASPYNSMVVHIAPANFVYETAPSNERIHFTMNHEVVHVVALDQDAGSDRLFRRLFNGKVREHADQPLTMLYGYLTLPRRAAPRWFHEGIAVFMETWMAGGYGRAQGPYDEMVFRSMVKDGTPIYDPLGLESEGTKIDFQVGVNSYLYGTRFMTYLAHTYGPERVLDWVRRAPGSRKYFAAQFQNSFGIPLRRGWSDWIAFERSFQQVNLDSIRRYPTTPSRDLSRTALGSVSRIHLDVEKGTLYAGVFHPGAVAHVAALPLDGGEPRVLREVKGPALYFVTSLAWDPDGRRLFYTTDNNSWRDLWTLDPETGRARLLIKDGRIGDLCYARADSTLWAVRHFNGVATIVRLKPPYDDWTRMHSYAYGTDVYDLDVSPDGRQMVASFGEVSGRQTLRMLDTEALARGDTTARVLHDFGSAVPANFVFSPDGRYLYGSSYYTGVSNIFRYDVAADSMDIVSNGETGYFRPLPHGDSLIVLRYTGQGFVPAMIAPRPLHDVSAITFLGQKTIEKHPELERWAVPSPARVPLDSLITYQGPYRALSGVRPSTAYPIVEAYEDHTSLGWRLNLTDPVGFHTADVSATFTPDPDLPDDERWHLRAGYKRFNLSVGLRYNPASFYDLFGPTKVARKGYGGDIEYTRPLVYDTPRTMDLVAHASVSGGFERHPEYQNVATGPQLDRLLAGSLELRYTHTRQSIGAVEPEKGHLWRLEGMVNRVRSTHAGGARWENFPLIQGALDVGAPVPGMRNASLWLRTAAGAASGDRDEPFANFFFGGFGNNWLDYQEPKRYRQIESFPGVELNAVGGTNFAKATLDWNLPPLRFERAGTLALYAPWARVSLFSSGIATNLDRPGRRRRAANVGAQADVRFQLLTLSPLTLSGGWARAFERRRAASEEWMVSLKVL